MQPHLVASLYKFVSLPDYEELRGVLLSMCESNGIRGTILLAEEGINGTVAGSKEAVLGLLSWLREDPRFADLEHKESWSEAVPFQRLKVRLKREIVTLGVDGVDPTRIVGTYVDPKDWNGLVEDPEVLVIDARNTYETDIGQFRDSRVPHTDDFRQFPSWFAEQGLPKDQKIAMYCTGGIRCEKATSFLKDKGFEQVYHLKGGILRYMETVAPEESLWGGECFVFDERVSVDHQLQPGPYVLCHACGRAVGPAGTQSAHYRAGVSCARCVEETTEGQKARFAERARQIELAQSRGERHLGVPQGERSSSKRSSPPTPDLPILYSFRRCPYAMRARMAICVSGQRVGLREVALRDKPPSLLTYSPKATVPVLVLPDGRVIDESLDVMQWALAQADPQDWLRGSELHGEMAQWVADNDEGFKFHLDRYKYATRYDGVDAEEHRKEADAFLARLDAQIGEQPWLYGDTPSYVDIAIGPFIRQFANTDRSWFEGTPYARLQAWLTRFLALPVFADVMVKYPPWREGDPGVCFPASNR